MIRLHKLFCVIYISLLFSLIPLSAYAHPGRTDGNGGHTDHSTGDYHYHHGYEAHEHYDMDGDGDLDCPFNFKDNTSKNKGTTSESGGKTSGSASSNATKTNASQHHKTIIENVVNFFKICGCVLLFGLMILGGISKSVTKSRSRFTNTYSKKQLFSSDGFWTTFTVICLGISGIVISILIFHPEYNIFRFFK